MVTICRTSALLPHAHLQTIWIIWNLLGNTIHHCLLLCPRPAQCNSKHCQECFGLCWGGHSAALPCCLQCKRAWQSELQLDHLSHLVKPCLLSATSLTCLSVPLFSPRFAFTFILCVSACVPLCFYHLWVCLLWKAKSGNLYVLGSVHLYHNTVGSRILGGQIPV